MGAFQSGFGMGQRAYQQGLDNDRQAKMDARQALMDSRADQDYERAQGMQRGVDEAFGSMQSLQRGVYDGSNADFNTPNPAMLDQGPLPRAAQPQLGLTQRTFGDAPAQPVARRNATELEMEQAMGNVALAQRDMTGLRNSRGAQKQLFKQQDQRDFVANIQKLAASDDPKDQAEYQRLLSPALSAYSQFTGIPSNFHFDPTTKSIVETPYGKKNEDGTIAYGAPRGVPMEQAMPFLLAHRSLTQDYGDTEAAFKAMQGMKEEERNRLIAEASRTFTQATGLGKAQNDRDMTAATVDYRRDQARFQDATLAETSRSNQAREKATAAAAARERMGAPVQMYDKDGNAVLGIPTMTKDGMVLQQVDMKGMTFAKGAGAGAGAGTNKQLQVAQFKDQADQRWNAVEPELMKTGMKGSDINQARAEFYARQGFAPREAIAEMMNPAGRAMGGADKGRKLTPEDVDSFNRMYPNSPLDKEEIPWLKKPKAKEETGPAKPAAPTLGLPSAPRKQAEELSDLQRDNFRYGNPLAATLSGLQAPLATNVNPNNYQANFRYGNPWSN